MFPGAIPFVWTICGLRAVKAGCDANDFTRFGNAHPSLLSGLARGVASISWLNSKKLLSGLGKKLPGPQIYFSWNSAHEAIAP